MAKKHKNKKHTKFSLTKKLLIAAGSVVLLGGVATAVAVPLVLSKPKDTGIKIDVPVFGKTIQAYCYMGSDQGSFIKLSATLSEKNKEKEVVWQKVSGSYKISIDENSGVISWLPFNKSEGPDIKFKIKASVKDEPAISNTQSFTIHLNQSKMAITSTNFGDDDTIFSRYDASTDVNAIQLEANFAPSEDENLLSSFNGSQDAEWALSNIEPATVASKIHVNHDSGLVTWDAITKDELTNEDHTLTFSANAVLKSDTSFSASRQYTIKFGNPVPYDGDNSWLTINAKGELTGVSTHWDANTLSSYDTLFIPTAVTKIGNEAFSVRSGSPGAYTYTGRILKTDVPSGLNLVFGANCQCTELGQDAFRSCDGLVGKIQFPKLITRYSLREFYDCTGITKVDFSKTTSLTEIHNEEFKNCTGLTEVVLPKFLAKLSDDCFSGCTGLTGLTFPQTLASIGVNAFNGCTNVSSFDVSHCISLTSIDKSIIYSFKEQCFYTEDVDNQKVYYDSSKKFCFGFKNNPKSQGEANVGTVTINSECQYILNFSFKNDPDDTTYAPTYITGLDISQCNNLKSIGEEAFWKQTKLSSSIVFPQSLKNLGDSAFDCSGVLSLDFSNCTKIKSMELFGVSGTAQEITSVDFPNSIKKISGFLNCPKLTHVNFENLIELEELPIQAFEGATALENIDLSNCKSLVNVGTSVFNVDVLTCDSEDNGIYYDASHTVCFGAINEENPPKSSLQINHNVRVIANNAFRNNITSITSFSMEGCNDIMAANTTGLFQGVTFRSPTRVFKKDDNGFFYDKGGVVCFGDTYNASSSTTHTEINKDELNFLPTTRFIAPLSFKGTTGNIGQMNLPPLLNGLGCSSMIDFSALQQTSITFPYSIKFFDTWSFANNKKITSIALPVDLQYIGNAAFGSWKALKTLVLPNNVRGLKEGAFSGCTSLTKLVLNNGLEQIGSNAFGSCPLGGELVFPSTLTTLDQNAFNKCTGLTEVNLSQCNNIDTIYSNTFGGCTSLKNIILSPSITNFEASWCGNGESTMDSISLPYSTEQIESGMISGISQFPNVSMNGVVYIKKGTTREMYLNTYGPLLPSSYRLPSVVWKATL